MDNIGLLVNFSEKEDISINIFLENTDIPICTKYFDISPQSIYHTELIKPWPMASEKC